MKKVNYLFYFLTMVIIFLSDTSYLMMEKVPTTEGIGWIFVLMGPLCLLFVSLYCNYIYKPKHPIMQLIPCTITIISACVLSLVYTDYYYILAHNQPFDSMTHALTFGYYEIVFLFISIFMIIYQIISSIIKHQNKKLNR